jgi:hypothetical protein
MRPWYSAILLTVFAPAAWAQAPSSPCDLLNPAEVTAAAGWKPGEPKAESYGTTSVKHQVVVVVLARPAPKVTTSAEFAERRSEQAKRNPDVVKPGTPLEGLGAPAIRSDDGSGPATIEAVVAGKLLGVTAPTADAAEALTKIAIPRVR